jgi:hypothetical protein
MIRGKLVRHRLLVVLAIAAAAVAAVAIPAASGGSSVPNGAAKQQPELQNSSRYVFASSAKSGSHSVSATCDGGSIAAGRYSSLTIDGVCTTDLGPVVVHHDLTIESDGALFSVFGDGAFPGSSGVVVGGNLVVQENGVLVLGCDPNAFSCLDDDTTTSRGAILGNLIATDALAVIVHDTSIGGDLTLDGGGGGVNCDPQDVLDGSPAYATFEDSSVGGTATIANFTSCWLGLIRTSVGHNIYFHDNVLADPDGNEVVTNTAKNLNCYNDNPAAQVGDSAGDLNLVAGSGTGECASLIFVTKPVK